MAENVRHCKPRNSRRAPTCTPRRWRITGQGTTWLCGCHGQPERRAEPAEGDSEPAGKGTWYGQQAQKLKNSYAEYSQPDAFDQANQWFDQPRIRSL